MRRCEDVKMWRWEDVKMRRCKDEKTWRWEDEKMWRCEDGNMWRSEDEKMIRCEDVRMRRCEDVKLRRLRRWEDVKMWGWEDVSMWRCEDENMRRWEDEKMWRCEDMRMRRCEYVKMRRCEYEKMRRCEDVRMRRCEYVKMWRWEDEKMFYRPHYWKNPALRRSREQPQVVHPIETCPGVLKLYAKVLLCWRRARQQYSKASPMPNTKSANWESVKKTGLGLPHSNTSKTFWLPGPRTWLSGLLVRWSKEWSSRNIVSCHLKQKK